MQVSFITDEYAQDLEAALIFAARSGMAKIELRSLWGRNCLALEPAEIDRAEALLRAYGIGVTGLGTFVFKGRYGDAELRRGGRESARRAADLAARLGADFIRIFAFWRDEAPAPEIVAGEIDVIAAITAQAGVDVLVENGTFSTVGQGSDLARLLDLVGRPDVGALWDPGNVLNGGWPESIDTGVRALASRIRHVHVKNPHRQTDGSLRYGELPGGEIHWADHIATLAALGYDGVLSLETHWRTNRALIGRAALDFPEGEGFSSGGEGATALMALQLQQLLAPDHQRTLQRPL